MAQNSEAVGREVVSFEAELIEMRPKIAREVARRLQGSRLACDVTSADREDAVAVGLGAIWLPVAPVDRNGRPQPSGDWWERYGADVVHDTVVVTKFGADRAMQYLGREVAKRRKERDAQARWLRHLLPLVAVGDPTGDSAVRSVIREKQRVRVRAAVEALDKPERLVVEARYFATGTETWKNIAANQDISIGKAHRLHDAALRQLEYWLRPEGNSGPRG